MDVNAYPCWDLKLSHVDERGPWVSTSQCWNAGPLLGHWVALWYFTNGLGKGVVPSRNKPLPEPMLIKSYNAIWRH